MSEFYPSSSSSTSCEVPEDLSDKYKTIVSQLKVKKCEGGCGTEFYFKYHDSRWYQYQGDNMVCSYPLYVYMANDENRVICQECHECEDGDMELEDRLDVEH